MLLLAFDGLPQRFTPRQIELLAFQDDLSPARGRSCFLEGRKHLAQFDQQSCLANASGRFNMLLVEDSHANHLWYGLSHLDGINVKEIAASGCPALLNSRTRPGPCGEMMRFAFTYLTQHPHEPVWIAGRWTRGDAVQLAKTLQWLKSNGNPVVLSGPVPEYSAALPQLLSIAEGRGDIDLPTHHLLKSNKADDRAIANVANRVGIPYLSLYDSLCGSGTCRTLTTDGAAEQSDYGHLTREGSIDVVRRSLAGTTVRRLFFPPS